MALTQSARVPGPSWDEEVVPALRKRLESESRTLTQRMSSFEEPDSHSAAATRPSAQASSSSRVNGNASRARTYSQPYSMLNGKPNPKQPTRIPKATRTPTPNLTPPDINSSHSTISVNGPQSSGLLHEQPPFAPDSYSSQQSSNDDLDNVQPRPSNDSEEHPFEHWYRGEVSRNGGVGELRIAKRKEMLEIANYGHPKSPSARNAITEAIERRRGQRQRADSLGVRGSFYMDEERARQIAAVMDEAPLTDFEGEGSESDHGSDYYDEYSHAMRMEKSISPEPVRSITPTPSNLPRPSSRQRTVSSQRTTTPTPTSRGTSEPPSSSTPVRPRQQQQRSASANSTPSKRAPSPSTPATAKKTRTAASKATRARLEAARKGEENRRSIVSYPTPDDNMESAIPQWTQPVPADGNWDNVVLPAVARKQGLNGYQTIDGSPKPKEQGPPEPAPGTFGYDHSKYRQPQGGDEFAPIQMDEFGRPSKIVEENDDAPRPPPISTSYDEIHVGPRPHPPPSPVPFSSYAPGRNNNNAGVGGAVLNNTTKLEVSDVRPEVDEGGAGCCKCVVM